MTDLHTVTNNNRSTLHNHTVLPANKETWLRKHLPGSHRVSPTVVNLATADQLESLHRKEHGGRELTD